MQSNLPKVAFVCVHNACRSQIAEALGRLLAPDVFDSFSAGTAIAPAIQPDAVRLVRERYGIDMAQHQRPKPLDALPDIDVLVTMGCNVECPHVPAHVCLDWGLEDPTGGTDADFIACITHIENLIKQLREELLELLQN